MSDTQNVYIDKDSLELSSFSFLNLLLILLQPVAEGRTWILTALCI